MRRRRHSRAGCGAASAVLGLAVLAACGDDSRARANGGSGAQCVADGGSRDRFPVLDVRWSAGGRWNAGVAPGAGGSTEGVPPSTDAGAGGAEEAGAGGAGGNAEIPDVCGDGLRHPQHEACDLGEAGADEGCTVDCRVQVSAVRAGAEARIRELGLGPHPIAVSASGAALVYVQRDVEEELRLVPFAVRGTEKAAITLEGASVSESADPVVAVLPDGSFAVAFTSYGSGTTGLDVRLMRVLETSAQLVAPFPGDSAVGAQRNADILALDDRVVVAWTDGFSDVFVREFDFELSAIGPVIPVAASAELEDAPALARLDAGWCLAFRQNADAGERIGVFAEGELHFTDPIPSGVERERPALTAIGDRQLLLVHSAAASIVSGDERSELLAFVLDLESGALERSVVSDPAESAEHLPSLAWLGSRLMLSYQSEEHEVAAGYESSHAYFRELAIVAGVVRAGPPLLLAETVPDVFPGSIRAVGFESLFALVWSEISELPEARPELQRLFYPLPLADDPLYADTLPDRVQ